MEDKNFPMMFPKPQKEERRALLFALTGAGMVLALMLLLTERAYDDTDDKNSGRRSGMTLHTDYRTGCQYLSAGLFGSGLTPRLDEAGHHVGCRGESRTINTWNNNGTYNVPIRDWKNKE